MIDFHTQWAGVNSFKSHASRIPAGLKENRYSMDDCKIYAIDKVEDSFVNYGFTQEEVDYMRDSLDKGYEIECTMLPSKNVSVACITNQSAMDSWRW